MKMESFPRIASSNGNSATIQLNEKEKVSIRFFFFLFFFRKLTCWCCDSGVALKQLTSFFTQLKENDEEEFASSASDEA